MVEYIEKDKAIEAVLDLHTDHRVSWKGEIVMKRIAILILAVTTMLLSGCASWGRLKNDIKSDWSGGLHRTIKVYTANGDLIAEYEGKIDIEANSGSEIKFDFNGKRYIYYNCFVETIADI